MTKGISLQYPKCAPASFWPFQLAAYAGEPSLFFQKGMVSRHRKGAVVLLPVDNHYKNHQGYTFILARGFAITVWKDNQTIIRQKVDGFNEDLVARDLSKSNVFRHKCYEPAALIRITGVTEGSVLDVEDKYIDALPIPETELAGKRGRKMTKRGYVTQYFSKRFSETHPNLDTQKMYAYGFQRYEFEPLGIGSYVKHENLRVIPREEIEREIQIRRGIDWYATIRKPFIKDHDIDAAYWGDDPKLALEFVKSNPDVCYSPTPMLDFHFEQIQTYCER